MSAPQAYLTVSNLSVPHGFSTRLGGKSQGVYESLNLGISTGDDPNVVEANRTHFLNLFGVARDAVCVMQQVHGAAVHLAAPGWYEVRADAAVTATSGLALVVSMADCLPLLYHDPVQGAIGAAHAGWRGTARRIAAEVVGAMTANFGSQPGDIQVGIGPGIMHPCYQVGPEVKDAFDAADFSGQVLTPDDDGRFRLDLVQANREALLEVGIADENISSLGLCTHCDADRFYSHRRDGRARGSHWALIRLPA